MKTTPILFNGPMVRAILEGRKTQTRRLIMPQPIVRCGVWGGYYLSDENGTKNRLCPFGQFGDRLWVRETFRLINDPATCIGDALDIDYRVDGEARIMDRIGKGKWRPSIHMPRWASRITLEIILIRVERLRDMSNEDAQAEGIIPTASDHSRDAFADLWDSTKPKLKWSDNPWVWVIEFKRL